MCPLHDFRCSTCGTVVEDVYRSATEGAQFDPPIHCEAPMIWLPQVGRFSAFHESEKFTTTIEDPSAPSGHRVVEIDSLQTIRRLERESEQAERNGEGRRMVWRDYANNRSNIDRHTIMPDPSLPLPRAYSNGTPVKARRGDPVTQAHGTLEDLHE